MIKSRIKYIMKLTKEHLKPVYRQVGDQVWYQVRDQVDDQVKDQVWYQVYDQVRDQVWRQVWNQVYHEIN